MIKKIIILCLLTLLGDQALPNHIGSDFQYFNPSGYNSSYITHSSPEVLMRGELSFAYWANYSSLDYKNLDDPLVEREFGGTILGGSLALGLGLGGNLELLFSLPHTIRSQANENSNVRTVFSSKGFDEFRAQLKYAFFTFQEHSSYVRFLLNKNLTKDNFFRGNKPDMDFIFGLGYNFTSNKKFSIGLNSSYRIRRSGAQFANSRVQVVNSDVFNYSLAFSKVYKKLKIVFEGNGSLFVDENQSLEDDFLEGIFALKKDLSKKMYVDIGVGKSLIGENKKLNYRAFAGFAWKGLGLGTKINKSEPQLIENPTNNGTAFSEANESQLADENYIEESVTTETNENLKILGIDFIDIAQLMPKYSDGFFIFYDLAMSHIRPDQKQKVKDLKSFLIEKNNDIESIKFIGSNCDIGLDTFNKELKYGRAKNLKTYLSDFMSLPDNIVQKISLDVYPDNGIYPNSDDNNRLKNRSTTIKVKLKN